MDEIKEKELSELHSQLFILLKVFRDICEKENIWYSLAYGTCLGAVRHKGFIPWDTDVDVLIMLPDKEKFREAFYKNKPEGIGLVNYDTEKKYLSSHDALFFENERSKKIHLDIYPLVGAPSTLREQAKFAKHTSIVDKIVRSKYSKLSECKKKNRLAVFLVKVCLFFVPDKFLKRNIHKRETKYSFNKAEYVTTLANYGNASSCINKDMFVEMKRESFMDVDFYIPKKYDEYLSGIYGADYMTPKKY